MQKTTRLYLGDRVKALTTFADGYQSTMEQGETGRLIGTPNAPYSDHARAEKLYSIELDGKEHKLVEFEPGDLGVLVDREFLHEYPPMKYELPEYVLDLLADLYSPAQLAIEGDPDGDLYPEGESTLNALRELMSYNGRPL